MSYYIPLFYMDGITYPCLIPVISGTIMYDMTG